jgi:O-antigen/teichoic acid export membrane protein
VLIKHSFIYLVSKIIPAIAAVVAISIYTRNLTLEEYGYYSFTILVAAGLNSVVFQWITISTGRHLPECRTLADRNKLFSTAILSFWFIGMVLFIASIAFWLFLEKTKIYGVLLHMTLLLSIAIGWFELLQKIYNAELRPKIYGYALSVKSITALSGGVITVLFLDLEVDYLLLVITLAHFIPIIFAFKYLKLVTLKEFDRKKLIEIALYGLPLTLTYLMVFLLNGASRYFIEINEGVSAVGRFSAPYDLIQFTVGSLVSVISLSGLPLIISSYQVNKKEGDEKAREYIGYFIFFLFPIVFGVIAVAPDISNIFIGQKFRADAESLIPYLVVILALSVLKSAYFDFAFQLSKKTKYQVVISGAAAVVAIVSNMMLVPRFGIIGAAYAGIVTYGFYLFLTVILGKIVHQLPFVSLMTISLIALSTLVAFSIAKRLDFVNAYISLGVKVVVFSSIYLLLSYVFNLVGIRDAIKRRKQDS